MNCPKSLVKTVEQCGMTSRRRITNDMNKSFPFVRRYQLLKIEQMRVKREFSEPITPSLLSGFQGWKSWKLLLFRPSIWLEGLIWGPNSWMNWSISLQQFITIKFHSYATVSGTHSSFLISAWLATSVHLIDLLYRIILEKVNLPV